jgi:membrane carboxypeptidase/penicillin-binding protein
LLVYILENNRIVSKERMLEVYFNIIEWGPNVYGIGEASRFYFQKSPSELTFNECLFWLESSQAQENSCINLTGQAERFCSYAGIVLTNIMSKRGLLSIDDTIYKSQPLLISGAAKSYLRLKVRDSTPVDSLSVNEEFEF